MASDLEMTKLCAEAMGWNWKEHGSLFISSGTGPWEAYDPLHDDAQAMALVKKFKLEIFLSRADGWDVMVDRKGTDGECVEVVTINNLDLNRAIVKCVAQMQAKGGPDADGTECCHAPNTCISPAYLLDAATSIETEFQRGFEAARTVAIAICTTPKASAGCTAMKYLEKTTAECRYEIERMQPQQEKGRG